MENNSLMQIDESPFFFPKRSDTHQSSRNLNLACNYFAFAFSDNKKCFFKYHVDFSPEIPGDAWKQRRFIFTMPAKDEVQKIYGHTIFNNSTFFSLVEVKDTTTINVVVPGRKPRRPRLPKDGDTNGNGNVEKVETSEQTLPDQTYTLTIKFTNKLEHNSTESQSLYKKYFYECIRKLDFTQIRRKYFCKNEAKILENYNKLEVWPGFEAAVNILQTGVMINMNVTHRVFRQESALERINLIMRNSHGNQKEECNEYFKGCVVTTPYNGKTYESQNEKNRSQERKEQKNKYT